MAPGILENVREQDVLARAHRVDVVQTHQPEQGGDRAGDFLAQNLPVALPGDVGRFQRGQDADRDARVRAGCVDGELGGIFQRLDAARLDPPIRQPFLPVRCGAFGGLFDRLPGAPGFIRVDPGLEVLRQQVREVQQQVGHVAFGVDHDGRDAVQRRFFQQADAQTGLARAGHAHHECVRGQVGRVVKQRLVAGFACRRVKNTSQVEFSFGVHLFLSSGIDNDINFATSVIRHE